MSGIVASESSSEELDEVEEEAQKAAAIYMSKIDQLKSDLKEAKAEYDEAEKDLSAAQAKVITLKPKEDPRTTIQNNNNNLLSALNTLHKTLPPDPNRTFEDTLKMLAPMVKTCPIHRHHHQVHQK